MASAEGLECTGLAAVRRSGLLPRRVVIVAGVLLSLLAVKGMLTAAPAAVTRTVVPVIEQGRGSASGFAEAFTRAYLTWNSAVPERHAAALRPFAGPDIDVDAGLPVPVAGAQRVVWTATIDEIATDPGRVVVTVAAAVDGEAELRYLAVPVSYRGGALAVADYPALVGRPRIAAALAARDGDDVEDRELAAIVSRALGNYLAGAEDNLRADLADGARLEPPEAAMTLDDVVSLQWAGPGRVSAVVVAREADDVAYTLRYELEVVKRDRFYVAEINPPMAREESP